MALLIFGLVVFLGVHSVAIVSKPWRDERVAAMGEIPWKMIYSVGSLVGLVAIVYGFGAVRDDGGQFFDPLPGVRGISLIAMPLALIRLMASNFPAGYIKKTVKHPMLWSVIVWATLHMLMNGDVATTVLTGAILVWAIIDLVSAFRRPAATTEGVAVWADLLSIALGLLLTYLLVSRFHASLFGVSVV